MTAPFLLCCTSTARAANVPKMESLLSNWPNRPAEWGIHWFVRPGEGGDYAYAGAAWICEVDGWLCEQRNAALDFCFEQDALCIMLDDDLTGFKRMHIAADGKRKWLPISFFGAVYEMLKALEQYPALKLCGTAITNNTFFYNPEKPLSTHLFAHDGITAQAPNVLRYDTNLRLKIDYDMCLQQMTTYGGVLRLNDLLIECKQKVNRGGCQLYRSDAAEDEAIAYLEQKWGPLVQKNSRRPHEILLKWKGETGAAVLSGHRRQR